VEAPLRFDLKLRALLSEAGVFGDPGLGGLPGGVTGLASGGPGGGGEGV
jgi:hypothetical protein